MLTCMDIAGSQTLRVLRQSAAATRICTAFGARGGGLHRGQRPRVTANDWIGNGRELTGITVQRPELLTACATSTGELFVYPGKAANEDDISSGAVRSAKSREFQHLYSWQLKRSRARQDVSRSAIIRRLEEDFFQCLRTIRHPGCGGRRSVWRGVLCHAQAFGTESCDQEDHPVSAHERAASKAQR